MSKASECKYRLYINGLHLHKAARGGCHVKCGNARTRRMSAERMLQFAEWFDDVRAMAKPSWVVTAFGANLYMGEAARLADWIYETFGEGK